MEIKQQLQSLVEEFTYLVRSYKIPKSHINKFHSFKQSYRTDKATFFKKINKIEISVLDSYKILAKLSARQPRSQEINDFLCGNILKNTIENKNELISLKKEIHKLFLIDKEIISRKLMHFLSPAIINFLYCNKKTFFKYITELFNQKHNISFEIGYFRTIKNHNNIYWHDDYTLFKNKIPHSKQVCSLILNIHIALSKVTKDSSPLCFLKGTENLVYARSVLKFFYDNKIKCDEDLLLKATYLTEELYETGRKIKPNFLGLLPRYLYTLHNLEKLNKKFSLYFKEMDFGDYLVFSPHIMHSSPLINRAKTPRESLVFRFFNDDNYNNKNLSTCKKLIDYLSFAKGKIVTLNEIRNALFYNSPKINLNSQIYLNIYLYKSNKQVNYPYPRIYLEDLWRFFNN